MRALDRTHDSARRSWVTSANGHAEFPIQNLPLGVAQHGGFFMLVTAIGDAVLPLPAALATGWGNALSAPLRRALASATLNDLASLPPAEWTALRGALSDALSDASSQERLGTVLLPGGEVTMELPFLIGDYTDFYASIHHATNVGAMFRPDQPLLPNYKWVPIGYHGRASSVVVDGTPVRRPIGQLKAPDAVEPTMAPSHSLDFELELGFFLGGHNALGQAVGADQAMDRIFGCCLMNDWSARDIQAWEYQPLGPFLAKNFATTISPWVVTADALRPFLVPMPERPEGDPEPLPYLRTSTPPLTVAVTLEAGVRTAAMRQRDDAPAIITHVNYQDAMYWSPAQLVTHHASGGCALNPGDLLGSGTVSGTAANARGCLLERTQRGRDRVVVGEETRAFLEDGDEVSLTGTCTAAGAVSIGFGSCRGVILPS